MADGFPRFETGGQYQYQYQNSSHPRNQLHHRAGSPIANNRGLFQSNADTPSPNRSPGTNSPAHNNIYGAMYNHNNHRQNHGLLNGGAAHQNFQGQMNIGKTFQSQAHGHQGHHMNNQHNDHSVLGGQHNFANHQHTISTSTLSNTTPHFTPAHLQNGTPENTKPRNEHWAQQMKLYNDLRMAEHKTHYYARNAPSVNRFPGTAPANEAFDQPGEEEEGKKRRIIDESADMGSWDSMDLCGQGLKGVGPALIKYYPKLRKMYLTWNRIRSIPPAIGQMRFLTFLDLSMNELSRLPAEIGMLTNLEYLLLFDNHLDDLPYEIGHLYQLKMLGIEGNPIRPDYKDRLMEHGTKELVRYLREQAPRPEPPMDREWLTIDNSEASDSFTVLSWNILCDRAATQQVYGYTPSEALVWEHRKSMILGELTGRRADIICLQEVDGENYNDYFRPNLATEDYKGVYSAKSRAMTMAEKEAKTVDGPAIFYKNSKYVLLDKQVINFSREAIQRPDMKGEHDVYNRVMPRDHVAIVVFLENRVTGSRLIVANTHLTWEPWYSDIKIVQVAIMMEQLAKLSKRYAEWPPCHDKELFKYANEDSADGVDNATKMVPGPSMKYDDSTQIPILVCGDFNSTKDSGVYDLITSGSLSNSHAELCNNNYGNFTRQGMSHPFSLKSAYSHIGELPFTNYTPDFRQVIDWVFYSQTSMSVQGLLGQVDSQYMRKVPGWPAHYFPSDHLPLHMQFAIKERKERKAIEAADYGSRRESKN